MPRPKQTGDRYADKGRSSTRVTSVASEAVRGAGIEVLLANTSPERSASTALQGLALYDEGWLRIVSHEMGRTVYFKFKFSRGKHKNSYVFYRCDDMDFTAALYGILYKVEGVYSGMVRPTPDTPYD